MQCGQKLGPWKAPLSSSVCLLDSEDLMEVTGKDGPQKSELGSLIQFLSQLIFMGVKNKSIEQSHWDAQVYLLRQVVMLINTVPTQSALRPEVSMNFAEQRPWECRPSHTTASRPYLLTAASTKGPLWVLRRKRKRDRMFPPLQSVINLEAHCEWINVQTFSDGSAWYGANLYNIVKSIFWTKRDTTWFQPLWSCPNHLWEALTPLLTSLGSLGLLKGSKKTKYFKIDSGSVNRNGTGSLIQ